MTASILKHQAECQHDVGKPSTYRRKGGEFGCRLCGADLTEQVNKLRALNAKAEQDERDAKKESK